MWHLHSVGLYDCPPRCRNGWCNMLGYELQVYDPESAGPDTKKVYRIQLAFAQVPAYGSMAKLVESGCQQLLNMIDAGRLVLQWQVTVRS